MQEIKHVKLKAGTKEEELPGLEADFPYIATCTRFGQLSKNIPWHWHGEVELFYVEEGVLEYFTPGGTLIFPAGSGGMVNANILHMTRPRGGSDTTQLLHIFNPSLIGGQQGSLLDQKYVAPVTGSPQLEIIGLFPENEEEAAILARIQESFQLSKTDFDYEMKLRSRLSEIWSMLLHISEPIRSGKGRRDSKSDDKMKRMLSYIHEHYPEKISMTALAEASYISERECFRVFRRVLNTTPTEYLKSYRVQQACSMLAGSDHSIAFIGQSCGLGSGSYFGKVFRETMSVTPREYREKWQDFNSKGSNPI